MTVALSALIAAVVSAHIVWIGIVVTGTPLAITGKLRNVRHGQVIFLAVAFLTGLNRVSGLPCLLTLAEQQLRYLQGGVAYSTGFIEHALTFIGVTITPDGMFLATSAWIAAGVTGLIFWQLNDSKIEGKPLWT